MHLPNSTDIIAIHPLFGPDSFKKDQRLKIVMHPERDLYNVYDFLEKLFFKKKIKSFRNDT